jgi:GGDEF domain-containing protein
MKGDLAGSLSDEDCIEAVREIITQELDEKNYTSHEDAETIAERTVEAHEFKHHPEQEDEESQAAPVLEGGDALNDTMKPIVLSGKMKTIDVPLQALPEIPPYMVAVTKDEYEYLLVFRAYRAMQKAKRNGDDPDDADTMQEVLGEFDGIDSREGLVNDFIQMTAELAFALGLWMEELSTDRENDGDSKQALYDSIMSHAYDEVGHAVLLQQDNLKRAGLHATIISHDRSEEENS